MLINHPVKDGSHWMRPSIKEKIKKSPRLLCWVVEVDDIEDTAKKCGL